MILNIFMGVILLVGSIYDWKYYSLPVWLLGVSMLGGGVGLVAALLGTEGERGVAFLALLPGVVALLVAFATREQIGYGDGVLLLAMGGCIGMERTVWTVFAALAGVFVVSCVLLVTGRAQRNKRLPFVPFLLLGEMVVMLGGGGMICG